MKDLSVSIASRDPVPLPPGQVSSSPDVGARAAPVRTTTWTETGTPAYRRISIALFLAGFSTFSLIYSVQPLLPNLVGTFGVSASQSSLALSLSTGCLALAILCAGALGVQLAGPAYYFGEYYDKPTIGDPLREIEPRDILRANRMMYAESLLALVLGLAVRLMLVL